VAEEGEEVVTPMLKRRSRQLTADVDYAEE
jgi:hypothetical protein